MQFGFIIGLIFTIIIAIFAVQNSVVVLLDFFFAKYYVSQAIVILVCMAVGAVITLLLGSFGQIKNRRIIKQQKNMLKNFEAENDQLKRNIGEVEGQLEAVVNEKNSLKEELRVVNSLIDRSACNKDINTSIGSQNSVQDKCAIVVEDLSVSNATNDVIPESKDEINVQVEDKTIADLDNKNEEGKAGN